MAAALPALQDSHIHAVRAGLTWDTEMHWENIRSVNDVLASADGGDLAGRFEFLRPERDAAER